MSDAPRGGSPRRPGVSVIVPAFNAAPWIGDALASIHGQKGLFSLETIVVDDGSTDGTSACVEAAGWPVRLLRQANRGPAAARNAGLEAANGEYVAFLDADDLWPDGKLARQLELLEANPGLGFVVGDCRQFDDIGPYPRTYFEERGATAQWWGHPVEIRDPYARLVNGSFVTTGAVLMRRSCVERVGGFDDGLRLVEDLEYWLRVALTCPMGWVEDVCLLRRRHHTNTSRDPVAMSRSYLAMLSRHRMHYGAAAARQGVDLRGRIAREYVDLGRLEAHRRAYGAAVVAYGEALLRRPAARTLYYLLSAAARGALAKWSP